MPIESFERTGRVDAVLVGGNEVASLARRKIELHVGHGIRGDRHFGPRLSDVRDGDLFRFGLPKGIGTAGIREVSIVSTEELAVIAVELGLSGPIPPGTIGENVLVSGIPNLTRLPPGTKLFFRNPNGKPRTAVVAVWAPNVPCVIAGASVRDAFPNDPTIPVRFAKAANGRRGLVGFVFVSGVVEAGDEVTAITPKQDLYQP